MKTLEYIDQSLFFFINQTCSTKLLNTLMPFITNQKNWAIPIVALIFILMIKSGKRGRITLGVLIICIGMTDFISAQLIKPWIGRIRPSHEILDQINLLVNKGGKWSFPSNHAANTMALTVVISYFYEKYKPILILLTFLIGISRIYVGVHYPFDIIGGFAVGYIFAWGTITLWVMLKMRELKRGRDWVWYN
tara:strand:+ start:4335 stop:4910 length:576 start_codon:yes stop_codon:yes gene_type:complete